MYHSGSIYRGWGGTGGSFPSQTISEKFVIIEQINGKEAMHSKVCYEQHYHTAALFSSTDRVKTLTAVLSASSSLKVLPSLNHHVLQELRNLLDGCRRVLEEM